MASIKAVAPRERKQVSNLLKGRAQKWQSIVSATFSSQSNHQQLRFLEVEKWIPTLEGRSGKEPAAIFNWPQDYPV